jgi:hypothetical protein
MNIFKGYDSERVFGLIGNVLLGVIPLVGLSAIVGLVALKQYNLLALGSYLAIPMIFAPIAYYISNRHQYSDISSGEDLFKILVASYLLCFAISLLLLAVSDVRPLAYYLALAAMATIMLLETTLFHESKAKALAILLQITAFTSNIIWGISLKYYFFFGRTDPPAHAWYAANLLQTGHVTAAFDDYVVFPLWHILFSTVHMATGSAAQVINTMFITNGLIYLLIPPAIYCVARKVTGSYRIAMLSALIVSFYPYFVILGTQSLSRSITSCLAILLVLLLVDSSDLKKRALALFMTVAIVIYHPVAILFIAIILFMVYALQKLLGKRSEKKILTIKYFLFTAGVVAVYWTVFANELVQKLVIAITSSAPSGITAQSVLLTPLNELFNYLQYLPMLFLIILGAVFVLRSKLFDERLKVFMLVALLLIPVTFPGPMYLFNKLATNFNIERFYENGFLFMAIAMAAGFTALFYKTGRYVKTFTVLLFAAMVLLSVSNDFVSSDNPLVKRTFFTYYLTEEEVSAINHDQNVSTSYMITDYPSARYIYFSPNRQQYYETVVDEGNETFIRLSPNQTVLFRAEELTKRPLDFNSLGDNAYVSRYYGADARLWDALKEYNTIYDSSSVKLYAPRPVA